MTQAQQPEALRLAEQCDNFDTRAPIAACLRAQHARIQELEMNLVHRQEVYTASLEQIVGLQDRIQELEQGKCLLQIAEPAANLTSELADMLERSVTGLGHYRNSQNWSEADEEHIYECNALLERFNSSDDEREAAPQAVQPAVPVDAEIDAAIQAFDWEGWADPKKAKRAFTREALARWAAPAHPAEGVPAQAFKTKVFQALGIGSACDEHVVFVNIENLCRRADCLSAIEREFFMVETPPDESEGDTEPGEECLLNWGHTPEEYVKQFAAALAATQPAAQGLDAQDASVLQHLLGNAKLKEWDGGYRADFDISIDADSNGVRAKTAKEAVLNARAAQAKQGGA